MKTQRDTYDYLKMCDRSLFQEDLIKFPMPYTDLSTFASTPTGERCPQVTVSFLPVYVRNLLLGLFKQGEVAQTCPCSHKAFNVVFKQLSDSSFMELKAALHWLCNNPGGGWTCRKQPRVNSRPFTIGTDVTHHFLMQIINSATVISHGANTSSFKK